MAQTLTRLLVHIIFSTKNREPMIAPDIEDELQKYISGIARNHESQVIAIGGTFDHVHILLAQSKNIALASLLQHIKGDSSRWIKTKSPRFAGFGWQDGYGAFTISESHRDAVVAYIANQHEHHRTTSFQDELRTILAKYGVDYDERYLWS